MNEPEDKPRADGTIRRKHYGPGKQPWDIFVEQGWGPTVAAANVIRYLRRDKEPEHSLESARWYWARLIEFAKAEHTYNTVRDARDRLEQLRNILTSEEWVKAGGEL